MTKAHHLILTVDYEIFGNGHGCLTHCVLDPAELMMRIAEGFDARLTFFVEALEFMAMERYEGDRDVRKQLRRAVNAGHDTQLHLHPQWWEAGRENTGWKLEIERWRIGDLESSLVAAMVAAGKSWLEQAVDSSTCECVAFRAGGWCIQPSESVVQALTNFGFLVDSTVAPGFRNPSRGEWHDFRNVPDLPWWRVSGDVCQESEDGKLIEVPIVTSRIDRLKHLSAVKRHRAVNGGLAEGCVGNYQGPDGSSGRINAIASKLLRLGLVMLDFSSMPTEILIAITEQWISHHESTGIPVPIVAIAHTKNFTPASADHFAAYLAWARSNGITFSTYGGWLAEAAKRGTP